MAADVVAAVIVVALAVYALTGGADFGGGVWDLFARGPRARAQRELVARAIGPIWEANHVWLILVIVLLFVCFPSVYAAIGTALHWPLLGMLFGIVLRGAAFAFRSHDYGPDQAGWDRLFAVSSLVTPFLFGLCIAGLSSGRIRVGPAGVLQPDFFGPWTTPFAGVVGLLLIAEFAWLAAAYLVVEADTEPLRADFRRRGLVAGAVTGVLALGAVALSRDAAPAIYAHLGATWSGWAVQGAVGVVAIGAMVATQQRRVPLARTLVAGQLLAVLIGWATALYPALLPPDLTVANAAAPVGVLLSTLVVLGVGSLGLLPAFIWLYRVFKG